MKFLLNLLALLIYNTQISQIHAGITVQNLQNKSGFHIGKKVSYPAFHKSCQNLCVFQTYSKDHLLSHDNTKRNGHIPVLLVTFFNRRYICKNKGIIVLHFYTGTLFLIQRCAQIVHLYPKLLGNFKNFCCRRIRQCNPTALLWFLYFMDSAIDCLKNPYHDPHFPSFSRFPLNRLLLFTLFSVTINLQLFRVSARDY